MVVGFVACLKLFSGVMQVADVKFLKELENFHV
jgi:hypothetical protein